MNVISRTSRFRPPCLRHTSDGLDLSQIQVPVTALTAVLLARSRQQAAVVEPHGLPPVRGGGNRTDMQQARSVHFFGLSRRDRQRFMDALEALPEHVRRSVLPLVREVHLVDGYPDEIEGATLVRQGVILLNRTALNGAEDSVAARQATGPPSILRDLVARRIRQQTDAHWREVAIHEVTHLQDYAAGSGGRFRSHQIPGPLGQAPFVSWYAGAASEAGQLREDLAETATALAELRRRCLQRGGSEQDFVQQARRSVQHDKFGYILAEHWHYDLDGIEGGF